MRRFSEHSFCRLATGVVPKNKFELVKKGEKILALSALQDPHFITLKLLKHVPANGLRLWARQKTYKCHVDDKLAWLAAAWNFGVGRSWRAPEERADFRTC